MLSVKNKCKVRADGEVINPDGKCLLCTLANGQYVGGSFKCAPRAKVDDGLIEVCMIKPISRLRFVKILGTYTEGKQGPSTKEGNARLKEFFGVVIPEYDRERVHDSDIKKAVSWFNLLVEAGLEKFELPEE